MKRRKKVKNLSRSRMLELNVEYRDRMINLKVPDNQTIQVRTNKSLETSPNPRDKFVWDSWKLGTL